MKIGKWLLPVFFLFLIGCARPTPNTFKGTYSSDSFVWAEQTLEREYRQVYQDVKFGIEKCWYPNFAMEYISHHNLKNKTARIEYPDTRPGPNYIVWVKYMEEGKSKVRLGILEGLGKYWGERHEIMGWAKGKIECRG